MLPDKGCIYYEKYYVGCKAGWVGVGCPLGKQKAKEKEN